LGVLSKLEQKKNLAALSFSGFFFFFFPLTRYRLVGFSFSHILALFDAYRSDWS